MRNRQATLAATIVVASATLAACRKAPAPPSTEATAATPHAPAADVTLDDVALPDGSRADVMLHAGRVERLVPRPAATGAPHAWLVPAFIDSHVHLSFYPVGAALAAHGFAAAVDLGAPEATLRTPPPSPLVLVASGPMLTAPDGYPLDAWGQDGYGLPCPDAAAARAAVERLADAGAGVIKVALAGDDGLADAPLAAAVERAHARHLRVAAHALSDADAARAARAGVDLLAHTPVEPLRDATVAAWRGRAVISTLAAFGGSNAAVDNLRRLHAAGVTVLYGTDLGNSQVVGVNPRELALLAAAGLSSDEILAALTRVPAGYWGLDAAPHALGRIVVGAPASVVVLAANPLDTPATLAAPLRVFLDGEAR